jgi:type II secretory pathway component PulF
MLLVIVPRFEPIFKTLEEKGELPQMTHWLMAFVRLNVASFYLPALLLALAMLAVDEAVVRILRRKAMGILWSWLWVVAVGFAAVPVMYLVVSGLLLPVFKMSSTAK